MFVLHSPDPSIRPAHLLVQFTNSLHASRLRNHLLFFLSVLSRIHLLFLHSNWWVDHLQHEYDLLMSAAYEVCYSRDHAFQIRINNSPQAVTLSAFLWVLSSQSSEPIWHRVAFLSLNTWLPLPRAIRLTERWNVKTRCPFRYPYVPPFFWSRSQVVDADPSFVVGDTDPQRYGISCSPFHSTLTSF